MTSEHSTWLDCFRPRDERPIFAWAADHVRLSSPLTKTGPFATSETRHFQPIFDALQDDHCREVNCLKPVRGGGTLIADVWMPWTRENDPGPFMFVLQTDPIADDHFSKVLLPTIESVPGIARQLAALDRHKKTGRKIEFADGNHLHVNGPSVGNLQTNAFQYLVLDECWMYEPGRMGEAEGRVGDFVRQQRSKIFRVSQGGPRPNVEMSEDDWHRAYHAATIHEWHIECPACHKHMPAAFTGQRDDGSFWGMTWDRHQHANGDWLIAKCLPTVRFECKHCGHPVLDSGRTKGEWNRTGRYEIAGEDRGRKKQSFHWEAIIDYPWDELVELWLEACNAEKRGDLSPKLQFYHKRRAMFKDEASLLRGGLSFRRTAYEVNSDWPEEKARFASFDRQEADLYWGTVRAWSETDSRRLWFGKIYGEAAIKDIADKFKVPANRVGIDSAFMPKGDAGVYAMCCRNGWIAVRGDSDTEFVHTLKTGKKARKSYAPLAWGDPELGRTGQGRRYAPLIRFSKDRMNAAVQQLIDSGAWREPVNDGSEMEQEYAAQMASRIRVTDYNKRTGEPRVFWKETKNDHARDIANTQVLFAILAELLPDPALERETKSEVARADLHRPG